MADVPPPVDDTTGPMGAPRGAGLINGADLVNSAMERAGYGPTSLGDAIRRQQLLTYIASRLPSRADMVPGASASDSLAQRALDTASIPARMLVAGLRSGPDALRDYMEKGDTPETRQEITNAALNYTRFGVGARAVPRRLPEASTLMEAPLEQMPGGTSGLTTGTLSPEAWQAAARRVGVDRVDPTFADMGLRQERVVPAYGAWDDPTGVQVNPVDVARVHAASPAETEAVKAALAARGLTDMQIGSPATRWRTDIDSNARNAIKVDIGRGVTADEAAALHSIGQQIDRGLVFANTGDGMGFMNFTEDFPTGADTQRLLNYGLADQIRRILPEAKIQRAHVADDSHYVDFGDRLAVANAGQGQGTQMLDEIVRAARAQSPELVDRLLNSPAESVKAIQNLGRLQQSGQLGLRSDYENWLNLLARNRLEGALDIARRAGYQGLPAAAGGVGLAGALAGGDGSTSDR